MAQKRARDRWMLATPTRLQQFLLQPHLDFALNQHPSSKQTSHPSPRKALALPLSSQVSLHRHFTEI
jgi:hypothetical protein